MRLAAERLQLSAARVAKKEACVNKRRDTGSTTSYLYSALSAIAIAAGGCAGQTPAAHDARAAGEWTFRLPETGSPYAGLAISDRGYHQNGLSAVDDALSTSSAKVETAAPKPRPVTQSRTVVAKTTAAKPEPQPVAAPAAPEAPVAVTTQPEQLALATPATTAGDESRYSQREQKSQQQRDFRGGDAIVITASTLVIILLVVILILLLT